MSLHPDAGFDPRERLSGGYRPRPARGRYRIPVVAGGLLVLVSLTVWYAGGSGAPGAGPVPLIEADKSPIKIRPEQPGGMAVPHQDKLIFQQLNPGQPGPVVERLLPAPETPLPRPEPPPAEADSVAAVPLEPPAVPAPLPESMLSEAADPAPAAAAVPIPVPVPEAAPEPVEEAKAPSSLPPEPPKAEPARPEPPAKPVAAPPPQPVAAPPPQPVAAPVAGGKGVRIQIASVRSEDVARAEFQRLQRRFPEALGSLGLTVARTEIAGKGTYFRVQVGPVDEARANTICQTLKAQSVGCIVVHP